MMHMTRARFYPCRVNLIIARPTCASTAGGAPRAEGGAARVQHQHQPRPK